MRAWKIKLLNWEYWSFGMVYTWIYPVWFFLCLRARSFFFFSASNPSIKNGGFLGESKKEIYAIMPKHLYPATLFFDAGADADLVVDAIRENRFDFPLVGKPDIGGRGRGVKLLHSYDDLRNYVATAVVDFHIQKFIPFEKEAGIFYYRYPGEERGYLSGIVSKEFLTVAGDGVQSIRQLLANSERAFLQRDALEEIHGSYLDTVLPAGEKKLLVPYGNHARGALFLDDSNLIDEALSSVMHEACSQVKDFYFGRLDIRYDNWEDLKRGKNFCIIELNGAGSEPTHIYDPGHSLFFAWREIIRHWIILWRISRRNHEKGHRYMSFKEGLKMFREDSAHSKKLEQLPK